MPIAAVSRIESNGALEGPVLANIDALSLGRSVLERIDDRLFTQAPPGLPAHRAGAHMRHSIEFYECFFEGLERGEIDYDTRKREPRLESDRAYCLERIDGLIRRLNGSPKLAWDRPLWVRWAQPAGEGSRDVLTASTASRELQFLSSHTVHHYALIAIALELQGFRAGEEFGVAPSTLRHRREKAACAR
jgi:hypothetical protein